MAPMQQWGGGGRAWCGAEGNALFLWAATNCSAGSWRGRKKENKEQQKLRLPRKPPPARAGLAPEPGKSSRGPELGQECGPGLGGPGGSAGENIPARLENRPGLVRGAGGGGIGVARGAGSLASPGRTRCLGVRPGVPSKEVSALGPLPTWGHSPPWSGRVQPGEEREQ